MGFFLANSEGIGALRAGAAADLDGFLVGFSRRKSTCYNPYRAIRSSDKKKLDQSLGTKYYLDTQQSCNHMTLI
jgi:hypothetical protein